MRETRYKRISTPSLPKRMVSSSHARNSHAGTHVPDAGSIGLTGLPAIPSPVLSLEAISGSREAVQRAWGTPPLSVSKGHNTSTPPLPPLHREWGTGAHSTIDLTLSAGTPETPTWGFVPEKTVNGSQQHTSSPSTRVISRSKMKERSKEKRGKGKKGMTRRKKTGELSAQMSATAPPKMVTRTRRKSVKLLVGGSSPMKFVV